MEQYTPLEEASWNVTELHNIARKLEQNHITKEMAYKIRALADELNINVRQIERNIKN